MKSHPSIFFPLILQSKLLSAEYRLTILPPALDQFASKEGLPAGLDPEVNNMVNDEINKL
jgi:hypothetical protein